MSNRKIVHAIFLVLILAQGLGMILPRPAGSIPFKVFFGFHALFSMGGTYIFYSGKLTESLLQSHPLVEARIVLPHETVKENLLDDLHQIENSAFLQASALKLGDKLRDPLAEKWAARLEREYPHALNIEVIFKDYNMLKGEKKEDAHIVYQRDFHVPVGK